IQRRPKQGFGVPLDHWFRNELKDLLHDTLLDQRSLSREIFEPSAVRQLLEEHINRVWDHSARLWALLCLEMWQRLFLDGPVPKACPTTL
ncbi:MAG: asparagine synthase-related protein, partial [Planctomycetaceae bacterium]